MNIYRTIMDQASNKSSKRLLVYYLHPHTYICTTPLPGLISHPLPLYFAYMRFIMKHMLNKQILTILQ